MVRVEKSSQLLSRKRTRTGVGMDRWKRLCSIAPMILLFAHSLPAQEIHVNATVDSSNYLIGDWIVLTIDVERSTDVAVTWPVISDAIKPFEIVRQDQPTVRKVENRFLESSVFILTAFDSGFYSIPPLQFQFTVEGDTATRLAETSPAFFRVHPIRIDASQDIKDIKPPLSVPISLAEILPYLVSVLAISGLVWAVIHFLKKRKRTEKILPRVRRPAHEVAFEALRRLEIERLWQRGKVKEYHSELTEILRTYLELRYSILALEMTTEEILSSAIGGLSSEPMEMLKEILVRADLVKFAKFLPSQEENERSLALAFSFVDGTRPVPEPEKPPSDVGQRISAEAGV